MRVFRAHGLGNDYLVVPEPISPALIRQLCDRHTGVGGDGVLIPENFNYGVRIYNPDGSEAEKSGNGIRIFAAWLVLKRGAPAEFSLWTLGGRVACAVDTSVWPPSVRVEMGQAIVGDRKAFEDIYYTPVNLGNPHAVVWGYRRNWKEIGARLENAVEGRTNVQFVEIEDSHTLVARIWERGAGHTLSSGSSSCAVAAAGVRSGRVLSPVTVKMEGGELLVTVTPDLKLTLEGPVEPIAELEVDPRWLQSRVG